MEEETIHQVFTRKLPKSECDDLGANQLFDELRRIAVGLVATNVLNNVARILDTGQETSGTDRELRKDAIREFVEKYRQLASVLGVVRDENPEHIRQLILDLDQHSVLSRKHES
jgi:hypothetical protein